jgi:hypothetical protein
MHDMSTTPDPEEHKASPAPTGNASNPSARPDQVTPSGNQLLDGKAEKYLREVASIEDLPDEQDQQEMDDTLAGNDDTQRT